MTDITQRREICDHPEELCVESNADAFGVFTIWCKKCNTTFSRYDYPAILENRKKYGKVTKDGKDRKNAADKM